MSRPKVRPVVLPTVWLVWMGEYEPVLEDIFAEESDARRLAHQMNKMGYDGVSVEERPVK